MPEVSMRETECGKGVLAEIAAVKRGGPEKDLGNGVTLYKGKNSVSFRYKNKKGDTDTMGAEYERGLDVLLSLICGGDTDSAPNDAQTSGGQADKAPEAPEPPMASAPVKPFDLAVTQYITQLDKKAGGIEEEKRDELEGLIRKFIKNRCSNTANNTLDQNCVKSIMVSKGKHTKSSSLLGKVLSLGSTQRVRRELGGGKEGVLSVDDTRKLLIALNKASKLTNKAESLTEEEIDWVHRTFKRDKASNTIDKNPIMSINIDGAEYIGQDADLFSVVHKDGILNKLSEKVGEDLALVDRGEISMSTLGLITERRVGGALIEISELVKKSEAAKSPEEKNKILKVIVNRAKTLREDVGRFAGKVGENMWKDLDEAMIKATPEDAEYLEIMSRFTKDGITPDVEGVKSFLKLKLSAMSKVGGGIIPNAIQNIGGAGGKVDNIYIFCIGDGAPPVGKDTTKFLRRSTDPKHTQVCKDSAPNIMLVSEKITSFKYHPSGFTNAGQSAVHKILDVSGPLQDIINGYAEDSKVVFKYLKGKIKGEKRDVSAPEAYLKFLSNFDEEAVKKMEECISKDCTKSALQVFANAHFLAGLATDKKAMSAALSKTLGFGDATKGVIECVTNIGDNKVTVWDRGGCNKWLAEKAKDGTLDFGNVKIVDGEPTILVTVKDSGDPPMAIKLSVAGAFDGRAKVHVKAKYSTTIIDKYELDKKPK